MAATEREKGERRNEVRVRGVEPRRVKGTVVQTAQRRPSQPRVSELTDEGTGGGATLQSPLRLGTEDREREVKNEFKVLGRDAT